MKDASIFGVPADIPTGKLAILLASKYLAKINSNQSINQSLNHPLSYFFYPFISVLLFYGFILRNVFFIIPHYAIVSSLLTSCNFSPFSWSLRSSLSSFSPTLRSSRKSQIVFLQLITNLYFIPLKFNLYNLFPFILFHTSQPLLPTSISSLFLDLYIEPRLRISGAIPLLLPCHFMTCTGTTLTYPPYILISLV